jgi:hypothetical protein
LFEHTFLCRVFIEQRATHHDELRVEATVQNHSTTPAPVNLFIRRGSRMDQRSEGRHPRPGRHWHGKFQEHEIAGEYWNAGSPEQRHKWKKGTRSIKFITDDECVGIVE